VGGAGMSYLVLTGKKRKKTDSFSPGEHGEYKEGFEGQNKRKLFSSAKPPNFFHNI
jgi:hypothetical protein